VRDINRVSYKTSKDEYVRKKNQSYKCNNYRNIAHYYRSTVVGPPKQNTEEYIFSKHKEEYSKV
jgi:hypothetical protein